jgi:hypothetical protein
VVQRENGTLTSWRDGITRGGADRLIADGWMYIRLDISTQYSVVASKNQDPFLMSLLCLMSLSVCIRLYLYASIKSHLFFQ